MDSAPRLTELVNEHQTALRRMCFFLLQDASAAEDAVQETFLKAYKALPKQRGDCSEKSHLMRIALDTCRVMSRKERFRRSKQAMLHPLSAASAETVEGDAPALQQAIRNLPRKLRDAVLLYCYQDMTLQETADALGKAPATISKRLAQAQKRLCAHLERGMNDA